MYKAILKKKNGEEIILDIDKMYDPFYYIESFPIKSNFEIMVDLTPNNIIKEGGFTQISPLKENKIQFKLIDQIFYSSGNKLIYKEI